MTKSVSAMDPPIPKPQADVEMKKTQSQSVSVKSNTPATEGNLIHAFISDVFMITND